MQTTEHRINSQGGAGGTKLYTHRTDWKVQRSVSETTIMMKEGEQR